MKEVYLGNIVYSRDHWRIVEFLLQYNPIDPMHKENEIPTNTNCILLEKWESPFDIFSIFQMQNNFAISAVILLFVAL